MFEISNYIKQTVEDIRESTEENLKMVFDKINSSVDLKRKVARVLATKNLQQDSLEEKIKTFKLEFDPTKLQIDEELLASGDLETITYNFMDRAESTEEKEDAIISSTLFHYYEYGSGALDIPVTRSFFFKMKDLKRVETEEEEKENG